MSGQLIGIRVSKKGVDVKNAPQEDLILNERFPVFKVLEEKEDSITLPNGDISATKTITHNLGYKPIVLLYGQIAEGSDKRYFITGRNPFLEVGVDEVFMSVDIDDDSFDVTVDAGSPFGSDKTYNFHYYVMYEELEEE